MIKIHVVDIASQSFQALGPFFFFFLKTLWNLTYEWLSLSIDQ